MTMVGIEEEGTTVRTMIGIEGEEDIERMRKRAEGGMIAFQKTIVSEDTGTDREVHGGPSEKKAHAESGPCRRHPSMAIECDTTSLRLHIDSYLLVAENIRCRLDIRHSILDR